MVRKLNHVGIIAGNLEAVIEKFKAVGIPCTDVRDVPKFGSRVAFLPLGDTTIEIIGHTGQGTGDDAMDRVVRSNPGIINHISLEVDDIEATVRDFEKIGARIVEGCPRQGAHGRIAFFYPETTDGILIELCEV